MIVRGKFPRGAFLGLGVVMSVLAQGCLEQDPLTGDTTQLGITRQAEAARQVEGQYDKMKGQFEGKYNDSDVVLSLDVAFQSQPGPTDLGSVPEPTLVGSLTLAPRIFVNEAGGPMVIPYPVTCGSYLGGDDLTLCVQENGSPTTLHCKVTSQTTLNCNWYLNASSAPRASFTLTRLQGGSQSEASGQRFAGSYQGENQDYSKIEAQFRTFLEAQGGTGAIPTVSIVGSFTFYARQSADDIANHVPQGSANFPFTDGEYDPISNTLAVKIMGDNPIEVNCAVTSATALHCVWIGTHGATSYEEFDLNPVN